VGALEGGGVPSEKARVGEAVGVAVALGVGSMLGADVIALEMSNIGNGVALALADSVLVGAGAVEVSAES